MKISPPGVSRFSSVLSLFFFASLFLVAVLAAPAWASKKVIFDTDPGTDDALALMLALNSPELDVRAITVVPGNVTAEMGLANPLRIVSLTKRLEIPASAAGRASSTAPR